MTDRRQTDIAIGNLRQLDNYQPATELTATVHAIARQQLLDYLELPADIDLGDSDIAAAATLSTPDAERHPSNA